MYCGIDVAKQKSDVCILDKKKKVVAEFQITHNKKGFAELEKHLTKETIIGMETTGNYSKVVFDFLSRKYNVSYVDNVQMNNFARLKSPTIKNDKVDAKLIAEFLTHDYKKINPLRVNELKDLVRLYNKVGRFRSICKLMFKDQINIIFPELEKHVALRDAKGIPQLLVKYPSPELLAQASVDDIRTALNRNMKLKIFTKKYAEKIRNLAKDSVGVKGYPTSCFKHTVKNLLYFQQEADNIVEAMNDCLLRTPYYPLLNEFGYSTISLPIIVGEVGDIRRFPTHKHFVSYCGFDVSEKTSGTSLSKVPHITKKGNRVLRNIFYVMVLTNIRNKTEVSKFFHRLKDKGKHGRVCVVATARKLAIKAYYDMKKCHEEPEVNHTCTT